MSAPALTWRRSGGLWAGLLRGLGYVTCPAAAGAAVLLLSLGVVTWLPALAAGAHALDRWRRDDDTRCFFGTLAAFRRYVRPLAPHAVASTAVAALLVANAVFLTGRAEPVALVLLLAQAGLAAIAVVHHVALAVAAGRDPDGDVRGWLRAAFAFGFGSPVTGTALLAAAIAAPVLTVVVPFGPLLLGPTLPLVVGLALADRVPSVTEASPPSQGRCPS